MVYVEDTRDETLQGKRKYYHGVQCIATAHIATVTCDNSNNCIGCLLIVCSKIEMARRDAYGDSSLGDSDFL